MSWVVLIILVMYCLLIVAFLMGYGGVRYFEENYPTITTGFTIIIPFRNEANHLPALLSSLEQIDYPIDKYKILLINDASTDDSTTIITTFINAHPSLPIQLLDSVRKTSSPKKDALSLGIAHAQFEWILTTDADCTVPPQWLNILNSFIQKKDPKMIVGPVAIASHKQSNLLHGFEQLDFLSLMGATMGGFGLQMPFLCNGAHLAYPKVAFMEVQGFTGNDHIASGDDHFLLEKFTKVFPSKVHYLKNRNAIVTTSTQNSWPGFISQRVRWAAKGKEYSYWFSKIVGMLVLSANIIVALILVSFPFLIVLDSAFAKALFPTALFPIVFVKWLVDFILITKAAVFFNKKKYLRWYPLVMLCYPFVSVFIAVKALSGSFEWKGRQFNQ